MQGCAAVTQQLKSPNPAAVGHATVIIANLASADSSAAATGLLSAGAMALLLEMLQGAPEAQTAALSALKPLAASPLWRVHHQP